MSQLQIQVRVVDLHERVTYFNKSALTTSFVAILKLQPLRYYASSYPMSKPSAPPMSYSFSHITLTSSRLLELRLAGLFVSSSSQATTRTRNYNLWTPSFRRHWRGQPYYSVGFGYSASYRLLLWRALPCISAQSLTIRCALLHYRKSPSLLSPKPALTLKPSASLGRSVYVCQCRSLFQELFVQLQPGKVPLLLAQPPQTSLTSIPRPSY